MAASQPYDIVGCGFGPSNLALAVAVVEKWLEKGKESCVIQRVCFIERHPRFLWHPGMLLPSTLMQISFLKDIATLRNPTSPFTFLSYLHFHNRLASFINRGSFIPTRREFADYLTWVSERVQELGIEVRYGEELVSLNSAANSTVVECMTAKISDSSPTTLFAKNISIAPGGYPRIPPVLASAWSSPAVIHTSSYALSIAPIMKKHGYNPRPLRIAVIGSGQSAAEVFLDLHNRLLDIPLDNDRHEIDLIIRNGSLKPSDDSPFVNEIFDPNVTDQIYSIPSTSMRQRVVQEYRGTNYGVVNPKTIELIYEIIYNQKLEKDMASRITATHTHRQMPLLRIIPYQSIIQATLCEADNGEMFALTLQNKLTGDISTSPLYDNLILGTGYERKTSLNLISNGDLASKFGFVWNSNQINAVDSSNETSSNSSPSTPSSLSSSLIMDASNDPCHLNPSFSISRRYRLIPAEEFRPRIYLQGLTESQHGLSDTLLSVISIRAGEILDDMEAAE